jgi:hypothetical protein
MGYDIADHLKKMNLYIEAIKEIEDQVSEIKFNNKIENEGPHTYCQICVGIKFKDGGDRPFFLHDIIVNGYYGGKLIGLRSTEINFTLYIGQRRSALEDDDPELENKIQEQDYTWIWERFAWEFRRHSLEGGIRVIAEDFVTEKEIRSEERWKERKNKEIEERKRKTKLELGHPMPEEGQHIAVKKGRSDQKLHLVKVNRISYDPVNDSFKVDGANVGKYLAPGREDAYVIQRSDIYAVFLKEKLPSALTMDFEVVRLIERKESFEGLIWRRPY